MFCVNCGKEMSDKATMCPDCGHPTNKSDGKKNKVTFVLLALLLGGFGIHRMYLNTTWNWLLGILYLCFVWTGVPSIIAILEAIVIGLRKDDNRFKNN